MRAPVATKLHKEASLIPRRQSRGPARLNILRQVAMGMAEASVANCCFHPPAAYFCILGAVQVYEDCVELLAGNVAAPQCIMVP